MLTLGEYGVFGDDEGHFNGPTGVAFLPDGRVVVPDGYWNSRLVVRALGGGSTGAPRPTDLAAPGREEQET